MCLAPDLILLAPCRRHLHRFKHVYGVHKYNYESDSFLIVWFGHLFSI